jgi:hypothetical protein
MATSQAKPPKAKSSLALKLVVFEWEIRLHKAFDIGVLLDGALADSLPDCNYNAHSVPRHQISLHILDQKRHRH